jgi:hypothetical protein
VGALVGNEDSAHYCSTQLFQALNDVGWTVPAVAACYWVGEAMGSTDFENLPQTPEIIAKTAHGGRQCRPSGQIRSNSRPIPGEG